MEAISAKDMAVKVFPIPARIVPYTNATGPPLIIPNWKMRAIPAHDDCKTNSKLKTAGKLMYRWKKKYG